MLARKKYKANDYGFVEFNDNGADFAQFKDANMDTRYSVREKVSGDILGYLPLETGALDRHGNIQLRETV